MKKILQFIGFVYIANSIKNLLLEDHNNNLICDICRKELYAYQEVVWKHVNKDNDIKHYCSHCHASLKLVGPEEYESMSMTHPDNTIVNSDGTYTLILPDDAITSVLCNTCIRAIDLKNEIAYEYPYRDGNNEIPAKSIYMCVDCNKHYEHLGVKEN